MNLQFKQALVAARAAVSRHGGGWRGIMSVVRRSGQVLRALGPVRFLDRLRAAGRETTAVPLPADGLLDITPAPPNALDLRVGIMVHVFYPDLLDELSQVLAAMPVSYELLVSVMDDATADRVRNELATLPNVARCHVRIVSNRGRDLAPLLVTFRDEILALDVVAHIHTKKSLYTGSEQHEWRRYLTGALLGSPRRIEWVLGMFQAEPRLGLVYPDSFVGVPLWAHTWLSNLEVCRALGQRLGLRIDAGSYIDFPAGSMFWARVDALRPLFDLKLELDDFPEEAGQTDGTLQHAIERMFVMITRRQGLLAGIMPADGSPTLLAEGGRNWTQAFTQPLAQRLAVASIDAKILSLDVFDTLVTRPFLTPAGARAYLAHLALTQLGVDDFAALRAQAEARADATRPHVDLETIYRVMSELPGAADMPTQALLALELDTERRLLRRRESVLVSLAQCPPAIPRIALSDMYLDGDDLQHVLPDGIWDLARQWYVSCETGWRKDTGRAWQQLPSAERVAPAQWLHVGDNEHADIQLPQAQGYLTPVHVLRPSTLLDIVPALRPLRPAAGADAHWHDQLWLGLVTRHLADLADRNPAHFVPTLQLESAASFGYLVLGPLLADYTAWLARAARTRGVSQILFLSREGHLLLQAFELMQRACPDIAQVRATYLLASRRGTGTPTLRTIADVADVLGNTFTGTLHDLIAARLGRQAAAIARSILGAQSDRTVYLPEMRDEIVGMLAPAMDTLLSLAADERVQYLAYWNATVDDRSAMVADLGYAGTIQRQLSRLTGHALGGGYFAVNAGITRVIEAGGWADARYHDAEASMPSAILRHDLLLETFLSAPDGQFSHFEAVDGHPVPRFGAHELDSASLASVESAQQGALAFLHDLCDVTGAETWQLTFDTNLVQGPLSCVGSGRWQLGAWSRTLRVRDDYTGRGEVAAAP